eukprot:GDKK01064543.1.p1 GENE.GDKK01064543.1~~GDKK01064543.1.p1  ORF type:complete len:274 (+),score=-12.69 GDKK01064543.1:1-822(+)
MEWLAWFAYVLKSLPIDSSALVATAVRSVATTPSRQRHNTRPPGTATTDISSIHLSSREGTYTRNEQVLQSHYVPLYSKGPAEETSKSSNRATTRDAAGRILELHAALPPPQYPRGMTPIRPSVGAPMKVLFDNYCLIKHAALPSGSVYGRLVIASGGSVGSFLQFRRDIEAQRGVVSGVDLLLHTASLAGFMLPNGDSHSIIIWPSQMQGTPIGQAPTTNMPSAPNGQASGDPSIGYYATMLKECRVLGEPFTVTAMGITDLVSIVRCLKMA